MDADRIERIVEGSKRMQEIGEFTTSEDANELMEGLAEVVIGLFQAMQEATELTDIEIVSAIVGSTSGILVGWVTEFEDG